MATLGPQIVSESYGNLLKFLPTGEDGVTTSQVQITDGKGKVTPLQLATGSVLVDNEFTASSEVVFSGLTPTSTLGQYVSFDTSDGRLYYSNTSSIQNVVSASYAVSAAFAPNDGDWTIGSSYMTASGNENVYIPNALRQGQDTTTTNNYAHAEGRNTSAAAWAHAEGYYSTASGNYSHAEGQGTRANGKGSHAEGKETLTVYEGAHAEGIYTTASGEYSHAEGSGSYARDGFSHAEGVETRTFGNGSHAEGKYTIASQEGAHAEGYKTLASGYYSHAEGIYTTASEGESHAEGYLTVASYLYSHAEGDKTLASGKAAHSEGLSTTASGNYSHAEGKRTLASGSTSHAEGHFTVASGFMSHAEGDKTLASGKAAHSEGQYTTASGDYSHAAGEKTIATGDYSHAGGLGTKAFQHQTVVGRYNDISLRNPDATFVVGTGISDSDRASGLIVKHSTHEVAVMQHPGGYLEPSNGPGLYFGKPSSNLSPNSVRIASPEDGYMHFENYDHVLGEYVPSLIFGADATFLPS